MTKLNGLALGAAVTGGAAAVASLAMLAARGRSDTGSAAAPINATSHVLWGERALDADDASARFTLPGIAIHAASAVFWGALQQAMFGRSRGWAPNARNAALTTALAALTDLKLVPPRLTPGFERRLSSTSLMWVYGAFAVGLAIGGEIVGRRTPHRRAEPLRLTLRGDAHIEPSEHSTQQVDMFLDQVDRNARRDGGGSPAIKPDTDLDEDGKPIGASRNPAL